MPLSQGQMSDYRGAAPMLDALPNAKVLLGDRGYDADWFRATLAERNIAACIPSKSNRRVQIPHDIALYRRAKKSRPCPDGSRIGAASIRATIAAHTHPCLPSASQPPSTFASINES
jgi:transposase